MKNLFLSFCLLTLSGCLCLKPHVDKLDPMPILPNISNWAGGAPIIKANTNSYEVSKEFVNQGIMLRKFAEEVKIWKDVNKVQ